jgi:hypothetical protein
MRQLDVLPASMGVNGIGKEDAEAKRGATKVPTPCTACPRLSRISLYLGGPQMARKLWNEGVSIKYPQSLSLVMKDLKDLRISFSL